jgi:tetratricopeptide (TPR) repeat protein
MPGSLATRAPERIRRMTAVMMQRVLDEIEAAVDAATHGGHGRLFLLHGRLDDALSEFAHHRGDLRVARFGASADVADPEALLGEVQAMLDGGRTVVLGLADVDRAFPPLRWHDVFLRHTLPALVAERRLVVVASYTVDGVLGALDAERLALPAEPLDPAAAEAPLRDAFAHLSEDTAAKGVALAERVLGAGAIEGEVFTVAAVARVLDEDADQLTDWLDDYLDGVVEDIGFAKGRERPLARYRFRDRAVWRALHDQPPGRRVPRRYGDVLAELYGPTAPEVALRIWELSGAEDPADYLRVANGAAVERDHVRLLEVERDPRRVLASLREVVFSLPSDDLLRYARALASGAGSEELYDVLGVAAAREQWLGDAARCQALALELVDEPFPVVQRCISLAGALLELAHWQVGGEPRLGLSVGWLDPIVGEPQRLIDEAAQRLERAGVALEQVAPADREHWRAHLRHAVAQLDAARGDHEAAREGEERTLELLATEVSCNLPVLALFALADAREELGDHAGARDAARQGVQVSVARSELGVAARGLAKVGRAEQALGETQSAVQVLAFSLVIVLELGLRWAEPGLWEQLAECLEGQAAETCRAMAGDERAPAFLREVTGIDRDATEAFLGSLAGGG